MKVKLSHLFLGVLLGLSLSAQTITAQTNNTAAANTAAANAAKMERVEVEIWRKANPTVKIISPTRLSTLPANEQAMYRHSSSALILQGTTLSNRDIQDYEANKRGLPAYNNVTDYERANPSSRNTAANSNTANSNAQKDLERLLLSNPQAYKAEVLRTNPLQPNAVSTLSRAKYNALPADRRAHIDQNPNQFRIID
jgi:hypothetical protein